MDLNSKGEVRIRPIYRIEIAKDDIKIAWFETMDLEMSEHPDCVLIKIPKRTEGGSNG